jgi:hypothetical protein
MRLDTPDAASLLYVFLVAGDTACVQPLDVDIDPIGVKLFVKRHILEDLRLDPVSSACRACVVLLDSLLHAVLVQVVSACLAVCDRLLDRIQIFMTDHTVAFDLSPILLEAVFEVGRSHAEHISMSREQAFPPGEADVKA